MTWRAFIIGIIAVAALAALDPYTSFNKSYGWNTGGHFPQGAVFLLVFFTIALNLLFKLIRKGWALKQAELMLIWCMLIMSCVCPCSGMMRLWFPALAGPAYMARRTDIAWRDTSFEAVPETLVLTKKPTSVAAKQFFEGRREEGRFPWRQWLTPISRWALLQMMFFVSVLLFCAVLRKQWVERERLMFPLARVPLEFTGGSAGGGWLPEIFSNRAFVAGLIVAAAFRFVRAVPLFFGDDTAWQLIVPFKGALQGTPLGRLYLVDVPIWWSVIGFAYLVPADVSLSIWFFYLFGRVQLQTTAWLGSDLHYGGTWSQLMVWQLTGSYMIFTIGALFMARRHLADIARRALGIGRQVDDSQEPVSYRLAFWGFVISSLFVIGWFVHYGMKPWVAGALFLMCMSIMLVHARMVGQSGLYTTQLNVVAPNMLHGLGFGYVFGATGAILAQMHHGIFIYGSTALPSVPAIHAFRISAVFKKGRRMLLAALVISILVAMAAASWSNLRQAYSEGAANFTDTWGQVTNPGSIFTRAHHMIQNPNQYSQAKWLPFGLGIVLTGFVMFMRARFYWWPIQPIGLLAMSSWMIDRLWLPFLLGWLIKVTLMKFASGRAVRQARFFFIALILTESFIGGISTIVRTFTEGAVPGF